MFLLFAWLICTVTQSHTHPPSSTQAPFSPTAARPPESACTCIYTFELLSQRRTTTCLFLPAVSRPCRAHVESTAALGVFEMLAPQRERPLTDLAAAVTRWCGGSDTRAFFRHWGGRRVRRQSSQETRLGLSVVWGPRRRYRATGDVGDAFSGVRVSSPLSHPPIHHPIHQTKGTALLPCRTCRR